jgi:hypothetical protein
MILEDLTNENAPRTVKELRQVQAGEVFTVAPLRGDDYILKVAEGIFLNLRTNELMDCLNHVDPSQPEVDATVYDAILFLKEAVQV